MSGSISRPRDQRSNSAPRHFAAGAISSSAMRISRLIAPALVALTFACTSSQPAGSGDAGLKTTLHAYVVEFLRRNPTTNTYLGGAGFDPALKDVDGRLRDHSAGALLAEDQWLNDQRQQLEKISAQSLSADAAIDRDVALAQIAYLIRQHQTRRYQERALDTYVLEPFRALDWQLQGMAQTGDKTYGTAEEWSLVVKRVQAIPKFLENAEAQLSAGVASGNTPDPRMIKRDGIGTAESTAKYFAETLPGLGDQRISGEDRPKLLADLRTASASAATAYKKFRDFVASTYFADAAAKTLKPAFKADR